MRSIDQGTAQGKLADTLMRVMLDDLLIDPVDSISFPCGDDPIGQQDIAAARVVAARRLREAGQLDLADRLDVATIGFGAMADAHGVRRTIFLEWPW